LSDLFEDGDDLAGDRSCDLRFLVVGFNLDVRNVYDRDSKVVKVGGLERGRGRSRIDLGVLLLLLGLFNDDTLGSFLRVDELGVLGSLDGTIPIDLGRRLLRFSFDDLGGSRFLLC
jgi:hypothetical protein